MQDIQNFKRKELEVPYKDILGAREAIVPKY